MAQSYAWNRGSLGFDVWDRLWEALYESQGEWIAYIYRVDNEGRLVRPYLRKCAAWESLPNMLRDELGGGDFVVMIRSGRKMRFSGRVAVVEGFAPKQGNL